MPHVIILNVAGFFSHIMYIVVFLNQMQRLYQICYKLQQSGMKYLASSLYTNSEVFDGVVSIFRPESDALFTVIKGEL